MNWCNRTNMFISDMDEEDKSELCECDGDCEDCENYEKI